MARHRFKGVFLKNIPPGKKTGIFRKNSGKKRYRNDNLDYATSGVPFAGRIDTVKFVINNNRAK